MPFKWDDENKAVAIEAYVASNPTPENSMELVKEQAAELGCTANGLRTVLSMAKVYVKKVPSAKTATSSKGGTRVSKSDAVATLNTAIESSGLEPNDEIISKLTGKAALYFAEVITNIKNSEEE